MTSEPSPHRRANHFGNNHIRMLPAQVVQQHFRYQIHAGPTLFHKITDDGNAQLIHQTPTTVLPDLKDWLLQFISSGVRTRLDSREKAKATRRETPSSVPDKTCCTASRAASSS